MAATLDNHISGALDFYNQGVRDYFDCPVISYYGQIHPFFVPTFIQAVEAVATLRDIKVGSDHAFAAPRRLVIVLGTPGGVVEAVEKMAEVVRYHFDEVWFAVPGVAMSAGTIFCMSGDKIFMDYTSSLGPIDPQIPNPEGIYVPALGYIDKVNELIAKSQAGTLTDAELVMLQRLDLATLRRYEQARDLSVALLEEWLVKYKFKDWVQHRTTNPGSLVTHDEKLARARQIAQDLSDNTVWHSHGRNISVNTLRNHLKLEIEDYTTDRELRTKLRTYSELMTEFAENRNQPFYIHHST